MIRVSQLARLGWPTEKQELHSCLPRSHFHRVTYRDRLMNHAPRDVGERHYDMWQFFPEKRAALLAGAESLMGILGMRQ